MLVDCVAGRGVWESFFESEVRSCAGTFFGGAYRERGKFLDKRGIDDPVVPETWGWGWSRSVGGYINGDTEHVFY